MTFRLRRSTTSPARPNRRTALPHPGAPVPNRGPPRRGIRALLDGTEGPDAQRRRLGAASTRKFTLQRLAELGLCRYRPMTSSFPGSQDRSRTCTRPAHSSVPLDGLETIRTTGSCHGSRQERRQSASVSARCPLRNRRPTRSMIAKVCTGIGRADLVLLEVGRTTVQDAV